MAMRELQPSVETLHSMRLTRTQKWIWQTVLFSWPSQTPSDATSPGAEGRVRPAVHHCEGVRLPRHSGATDARSQGQKKRQHGKDAVKSHILAAKTVANIIKTSLVWPRPCAPCSGWLSVG